MAEPVEGSESQRGNPSAQDRRNRLLLRRWSAQRRGNGRGRQRVYTLFVSHLLDASCQENGNRRGLPSRFTVAKIGNGKSPSVEQVRPLASILAKGTSKDTMPTVRGRLWASGATWEGHCGGRGDSRLMNREGQVVRRPDRQGTDAAFCPERFFDARSGAAKTTRHRALGRSDPCFDSQRDGRQSLKLATISSICLSVSLPRVSVSILRRCFLPSKPDG